MENKNWTEELNLDGDVVKNGLVFSFDLPTVEAKPITKPRVHNFADSSCQSCES